MTPWLLGSLVLLDGTLCGFRAAAGRNPRIFLWGYYASSMRRGTAAALAVVALFAAAGLGVREVAGDAAWNDLVATAHAMLRVYGVYATLVVLALSLYLRASFDLGVLASVLVLGPFTLVRPYVIVGGAVYAAVQVPRPLPVLFAATAAVVMAAFERLLSLGAPPWRDTLPRVSAEGRGGS